MTNKSIYFYDYINVNMIKKITIIGSGNVATQLSLVLQKNNIRISQVISRNIDSGKNLAKRIQAPFTNDLKNILDTDLIIICVNDDEIMNVIQNLPNSPMVHTSGSTNINVFKNQEEYGVFYPLQSLNKEINANFSDIPICIEANTPALHNRLCDIAKKISKNTISLNSYKRKHLHLAAVIAANFSNFSYLIAKKHLHKHKIDFDLLKPLILHNTKKIIHNDPKSTQTGPAKRGDKNIIKEHLNMLEDQDYKKIYKLLSNTISKEYVK